MSILVMMIPVTLLLVTLFIVFFVMAVRSDQMNDLETPAHTMLIDENPKNNNSTEEKGE